MGAIQRGSILIIQTFQYRSTVQSTGCKLQSAIVAGPRVRVSSQVFAAVCPGTCYGPDEELASNCTEDNDEALAMSAERRARRADIHVCSA